MKASSRASVMAFFVSELKVFERKIKFQLCFETKNFQKKFLTVDHSAHMSMKDAAKCEN